MKVKKQAVLFTNDLNGRPVENWIKALGAVQKNVGGGGTVSFDPRGLLYVVVREETPAERTARVNETVERKRQEYERLKDELEQLGFLP